MAAQGILGAHGISGRPAARIAAAGWHVAVTRDASALAPILSQWEDLAAHALEPNPFYESWSLLPALEAEHTVREQLLFVQVWKQGRLDGLFPFVREPRFRGLPLSALRSWHHASHMLCTPLVRAGAQAACLQALLGWLRKDGGGAAAAEFRYLPADGAFIGALADATRDAPVATASTEHFTRALLRRHSDAEHCLEALSGDSRRTMRRRERRLRERGEVVRVALKPGEDATRWIAQFLALEASGWKGRGGSALASTPGNLRYARAMLAEAHRRGRLQIVGIDCDGRPVSRCCNLIAGEGSYAWRTAYDERYAEYSPGVMAELESIRALHAAPGVSWMDSITDPGNPTLNRLWPHRRTMQSVLLGFGAWGEMWVSMLPMMRWAARRLKAAAGSLGLDRSGDSLNGKALTIPSEI